MHIVVDAIEFDEVDGLIGTIQIGDTILQPRSHKGQMRIRIDRLARLLLLGQFVSQLHLVVVVARIVRKQLLKEFEERI